MNRPATDPSTSFCRTIVACVILSACTTAPDDRWTTPPAGTPVVTVGPLGTAAEIYTIDSLPEWTVSIDADDFDWRSGPGIRGLLNGGIALTERDRIHLISADGASRTVVGQPGDGPGEFRNIIGLCQNRGDTLVVYDMRHRTMTVVDPATASIVAVRPVEVSVMLPPVCLDDGTYLIQRQTTDREAGTRQFEVERIRLGGESVGVLMRQTLDLARTRETGMPMIAASGTVWYYADPYFSEIQSFDTTGALVGVLRLDNPVVTLPADTRPGAEGVAGGSPTASAAPQGERRQGFFAGIAGDQAGRLWVTEPGPPEGPYVRTAFDQAGRMLGRFIAPAWLGEHVYAAPPGRDWWLAMRITESGEILVERYRLRRPDTDR